MFIGDSPCADCKPGLWMASATWRRRDHVANPFFACRRCRRALWRRHALLNGRRRSTATGRRVRTENLVKRAKSDTPEIRYPKGAKGAWRRARQNAARDAQSADGHSNRGARKTSDPALFPCEQILLDDRVHAPVAVHDLGDAEVHPDRHERNCLVLAEPAR